MNQTARRKPGASRRWVAPEWGWAWPANRRMLYNRASADPDGEPWSERKRYVWWDDDARPLDRRRRPRLRGRRSRPTTCLPLTRAARTPIVATSPFIMQADGLGWLFAPSGLVDGPLPTHYEPHESPFDNPLYGQRRQPGAPGVPARREPLQPDWQPVRRRRLPVRPHHLPAHRAPHRRRHVAASSAYLSELQPEMFCEVSPAARGASAASSTADWATVVTTRAAIEARVLVTDRMRPLDVQGRRSTRSACRTTGAAGASARATRPTTCSRSRSTRTCTSRRSRRDVRHPAGRRPRPALTALVEQYRQRAGVSEVERS